MTTHPFDDRDGWIWQDGALVPWRDARLHVLSHGLHYASAVFEGERAYGGTIFRLREHTERLFASARILGFDIPYTPEQIDAACRRVLAANNLTDAYLRPLAWRGSEMLAVAAQTTTTHVAIAAWPWPNLFGAATQGVRLAIADWRRPDPRTAPTAAKASGLYTIGTMAKHAAEAAGYDDALMLDWRGQLSEATGANLFLVIDGALVTPTPDGFLDGITRRTVMDLACARGIGVTERDMWPDDLARASEVFLTGTAAEVTPVRQVGDIHFNLGPVAAALREAYAAHVRQPEPASQAA